VDRNIAQASKKATAFASAVMSEAAFVKSAKERASLVFSKGYSGPPMTLGNAAAAMVRLIVWCRAFSRQVEPNPCEMAERYGAETTVIDWHARLACSGCGSRQVDFVVSGTRVARPRASRPGIVEIDRRESLAQSLTLLTDCAISGRLLRRMKPDRDGAHLERPPIGNGVAGPPRGAVSSSWLSSPMRGGLQAASGASIDF
jgi:hypothetical protein